MAKGFGKVGVRTLSETREAKVLRRSVLKHFSQLLDPRVERTRQLWNKTTHEVCFYISSLAADAVLLSRAIRSHWSIENSLHWVLDVTFNEDASRIRKDYVPQNMGLIRPLCVNLLKREPSRKSIAMKRYTAGLNNDFLIKILAASAVS